MMFAAFWANKTKSVDQAGLNCFESQVKLNGNAERVEHFLDFASSNESVELSAEQASAFPIVSERFC